MLTEVTQEQFIVAIANCSRDIISSPHEHHGEWRTRDRILVGKTYPGYKEPGAPKKYTLDLEWFKTNQKL